MSILAEARKPDAPIGMMLAVLGRAALLQFTDAMRSSGVKPRHIPALRALLGSPLSQQALSETVRTDPTQLVVLLNELEAVGMISRRRDPENRRRHIVELSAEGRMKLAEAEGCIKHAEDHLLAGISASDRGRLRRLLTVLMVNIGSDGDDA